MKNNSIDITSLILQLYSVILLLQDFNNSDLMRELQRQDKEYLEKIIKQNNQIIQLLTKGSEADGRKGNWKSRRKNKRNSR